MNVANDRHRCRNVNDIALPHEQLLRLLAYLCDRAPHQLRPHLRALNKPTLQQSFAEQLLLQQLLDALVQIEAHDVPGLEGSSLRSAAGRKVRMRSRGGRGSEAGEAQSESAAVGHDYVAASKGSMRSQMQSKVEPQGAKSENWGSA